MPIEQLNRGSGFRNFLIKVEALEILALVGSGSFALSQGEVGLTLGAVGTIVGLAAWHRHNWLRNQADRAGDVVPETKSLPPNETPSSLLQEVYIFDPVADKISVAGTKEAIAEAEKYPMLASSKMGRRPKRKKNLG